LNFFFASDESVVEIIIIDIVVFFEEFFSEPLRFVPENSVDSIKSVDVLEIDKNSQTFRLQNEFVELFVSGVAENVFVSDDVVGDVDSDDRVDVFEVGFAEGENE
jgi:hypothetical protein